VTDYGSLSVIDEILEVISDDLFSFALRTGRLPCSTPDGFVAFGVASRTLQAESDALSARVIPCGALEYLAYSITSGWQSGKYLHFGKLVLAKHGRNNEESFRMSGAGTSSVFAGKWKVLIVWHLSFCARRFAEVRDLLRELVRRCWPLSYDNWKATEQ
jgi:hypothetical protein